MRKLILMAVLVGLLAMPVLAQFPLGGFGRGLDGSMLLGNPDVQKELKLTDEQKKAITEANDERNEAFKKAREDKDREGFQKAMQEHSKAMAKVKEALKPEQVKRLLQIEVQVAAKMNQPAVFQRKEVQKALKLTEKQIDTVKQTVSDVEKDLKELFEDAKGDKEKFKELFTKLQTMNKDAFDKVMKTLSEEQKTAWKELQGEAFELKLGGFGGFGKKKKKDDF